MADLAIAAQVDPNAGLERLNNLIGLKSGMLGLQQKQQALVGQAAQVQQEQLSAEAQQGTRDFFTSWSPGDHVAADGTTDIESAHGSDSYKSLSGLARTAVDQKLILIKQGQIQNAQSLLGLNNDQLVTGSRLLGGIAQDPDVVAGNTDGKAKVQAALRQWGDIGGPAGARVALTYQGITNGEIKKGELPLRISALQRAADTALQRKISSPINTGAETQFGAVDLLTGQRTTGAGQSVGMGIPPGFSVVTDPRTQNPYLVNNQTGEMRDMGYGFPGRPPGGGGAAQPATAAPRAAGGPPASLPRPNYQGQGADVQNFQTEVHSTRAAGDQVGLARNINQQILRLSTDAKTGPGTDAWQHVVGAVGAPFGLSPTASYQEVGKFLEKNALNNMQSMGGPPSDARLAAAVAANGGPNFSKEALQAVTKFNDATNTALGQYRQGMDHAVGMGQNVDYTRLPAFKSSWAQNFDVNVFRVENAIRDGDKAELAKIKAEIGAEGLKKLAAKRANLTALMQTGQLPQ
jgi:hypothetical protein